MIEYELTTTVNKKHKDRVFKLIFGSPDHKDWTLALYNAVNESNYTDPDDITITTMDDAVFMHMKNDVSFIISDTINLYEHQSSFNPNMPLRCLVYAGVLYSKFVADKRNRINVYSSTVQKVPVPKLVCFYNGRQEQPDRVVLSLYDAFSEGSEPDIDVRGTMLNINYGRNAELLGTCRVLGDYSLFVETVRTEKDVLGNLEEAVRIAIRSLPNDSPIKQLLLDNESEVCMSFLTEYDEEWTMQLFKEEYLAQGIAQGKEQGLAHGEERLSTLVSQLLKLDRSEDVLRITSDPEYRNELYKEFGIL